MFFNMLLLFFLALFKLTVAGITDLNCTGTTAGATKYTEKAVNCNDKLPSDVCKLLYTKAVEVNTETERDDKCFKLNNQRSEEVVQAAVQICPRSCGYCCITPDYNCKNKENPRVKCETITKEQCGEAVWRQILTEDCPAVCGFCRANIDPSCQDTVPSCKNDLSICRHVDMQNFVKMYCKATCGFCNSTSPTTASPGVATTPGGGTTVPCGNVPSCPSWVRNGFCTNTFYSQEQKRRYCGRACNLC